MCMCVCVCVYMHVISMNLIPYKGGTKIETGTWIHFIDSGGQPEFHDLLPLFIHNTSVVIFVFKLSEGLDQKPTVEYYGSEGSLGEKYVSYLTHKEILEHSLKVLKVRHGTCPTILVIGTHEDVKPQLLDIEVLKKILNPFRSNVIEFGHGRPIFHIDCLSCGNEIRKTLGDIRNEIMQAANKLNYQPTPIAWFGLELALKNASQGSKPKGILRLARCKYEASRFPHFKRRDDRFEEALKHLVESNIFLYYKDILEDIVFCDPQSLLNEVTQIVQQHYKLVNNKSCVSGALQIFKTHAYISDEILKRILPQCNDKEYILNTELLLKLFTELNIISKIDNRDTKFYLMPVLLPCTENPIAKVRSHDTNNDIPPLCIGFGGGCTPGGLFCSLVAHLLQLKNWELSINSDIPSCCYRNCVAFVYDVQSTVTLVDMFSHFRIYIQLCNTFPYIIKDMVYDSISAVVKRLNFGDMKYYDAIECPDHQDEHDHVAKWHPPPKDCYQCEKENKNNGRIKHEYYVWTKKGMCHFLFYDSISTNSIICYWLELASFLYVNIK